MDAGGLRAGSSASPAWVTLRRRLAVPLVALSVTHLVGSIGYWLLWRDQGGTLGDALFMTFTTITTIGFGEVHPLDGAGRALTMAVAAGGIGSLFYSLTVTLDWASSDDVRAERRRRKVQRSIDGLEDHYVLAGYGRVGREASKELALGNRAVVAIDLDPDNVAAATEAGLLSIKGDASADAVLHAAGIARARGLIVTTSSDATNLYIVMSARALAPALFIVSRAVDSSAVAKLERAGANRAVSPYAIGGRRMAHLMVSPRVVDFFETAMRRGTQSLSIGELQVRAGTAAAGMTIASLRDGGRASIVAVIRGADRTVVTASDDLVLADGDHVLALGTDAQLAQLETAFGG